MGFFNDLKETVTDTGKGISNKAKQVSDNAKLNNQIKANEKSIESLTMQIGTRFLEKLGEGEPETDYSDLVDEIRRLKEENAGLNKTIEANNAPEGAKLCSNCGKYNAPDAKFCVSCGAEIKIPEPVAEPYSAPDKFCPACGSGNSAQARFCISCGKPFDAPAQAQPEAEPEDKPAEETKQD